jgi:hypothetical protein
MYKLELSITGNVYSFTEIVQEIGGQDLTVQAMYQWVAGILGVPADQCRTLQAEISFGLLADLPTNTYTDPTGQWQLHVIKNAPSPVGWVQYVGPELTASPWELVWVESNGWLLEDLLVHSY